MSCKLGPHQLQIIAGYAERIDHPAVPAGKTGAPFDCSTQPLQLHGQYLAHGPELDDKIDFIHEGMICISFKSVIDPDPEATRFQEGNEEIGCVNRIMALPSSTHHEGIAFSHGPLLSAQHRAQIYG